MKHYETARQVVAGRFTTWDDLERLGKCTKPRTGRRGPGEAKKWFMEAHAGSAK